MSARKLDLELSRHQFGDAGQLRIVKPIPKVNAARFLDYFYPPNRFDPGPSELHIWLTSDAEFSSTTKSPFFLVRFQECSKWLQLGSLRIPEAAIRGF